MKNHVFRVAIGAVLTIALTACSHKTDANSELEKATAAMTKTEPAPAPVQPAQPAQNAPVVADAPAPAQQMNQAMAAYKAGELEDAVTRLQRLRATPAMTPQQRMALNDAMGAVMTEIYTLAARGDAKAKQAVKQYEMMQTQHR